MKVFQVCADRGVPPDGTKGASVHLRAVAAALARRGHDVLLFSARPPTGEGASMPVPRRPLTSPLSLQEEAAQNQPPDAIYERYSLGHLGGLIAARELSCPLILEVNAPLVLEAARHRSGSLLPGHSEAEKRLLAEADLVVTVSHTLETYIRPIRGARRTVITYNGCDPSLFPAGAPLSPDAPHTLIFLGTPKPWHGADGLPGLLQGLRRAGHDVRLLVIGSGPGADDLRMEARRRGLSAWVEITGSLAHQRAVERLQEGTVAVAPYPPSELFYFCPLKLVECMAAGLPVVTTAQGDLPDMVGDGGLLVTPGNVDDLAEACSRLLDDAALRQRLGRAARGRALELFTWERAIAALEAEIDQLVNPVRS